MTLETRTPLPRFPRNLSAANKWDEACRPAYLRYLERREQYGIDVAYAEYLEAIAPATAAYQAVVEAERERSLPRLR